MKDLITLVLTLVAMYHVVGAMVKTVEAQEPKFGPHCIHAYEATAEEKQKFTNDYGILICR